MEIIFKKEWEIQEKENLEIQYLLQKCFPEYFCNRTYFKQIPHFRLLAKKDNTVVGQVGLDYRMMSLNNKPIQVLGIIDLCILPSFQGQKIGSQLLQYVEKIALENHIDFLLLFADNPQLYLKHGFKKCSHNMIHWVKINEHETLGIGKEIIPELMIKEIHDKKWEEGILDMLGYLY